MMELHIAGKGCVRLEQSDFVGQGGEGKVYARDDTAYKVYADPNRMIPTAKIAELAALNHPDIVRPEEVLLDNKNRPVGYTMSRVRDAQPLCRLFTRAFRERTGLTPVRVLALVCAFQEVVQYIHAQGILIVDMNEMNFLADCDLERVICIDVDSYKTPGFPATAILDSIRDRHATTFSVETDWFSFAILTFQMFVGIHPYRGKHSRLIDLDSRMRANVSVLNRSVTVPDSSYPFDTIPAGYRAWYDAVFEQGMRMPPPHAAGTATSISPRLLHFPDSGRLRIREFARFAATDQPAHMVSLTPGWSPTAPRSHCQRSGRPSTPPCILQLIDESTALTTEGVFLHGGLTLSWKTLNLRSSAQSAQRLLTITPRFRRVVLAARDGGKLRLWDAESAREIECGIHADGLLACSGRLLVKRSGTLYEVAWLETAGVPLPMLHPVANVMPKATRLFEGVAVQDILGAFHVTVIPRPGCSHTVRIPELDGRRILDARCDRNVLMVAGERNGSYEVTVLRFDNAFREYDLRTIDDDSPTEINFVALENGICLWLNPRHELEVFSSRKGVAQVKILEEPALKGARLFKRGTTALFARGDTLYEMAMGS